MGKEGDLPHGHPQHQPIGSVSPTAFHSIDDTEAEEQGMTWGWFVLSVIAAVMLIGGIVAERSYERRRVDRRQTHQPPPVRLTPSSSSSDALGNGQGSPRQARSRH